MRKEDQRLTWRSGEMMRMRGMWLSVSTLMMRKGRMQPGMVRVTHGRVRVEMVVVSVMSVHRVCRGEFS